MSLVPVNLKVDFIANSIGVHRACYRLAGSTGPYTCVNTTCTAIGSCEILLPIFVNNETCAVVQYEGYVQPGCMDVASTLNRTAWTYTFTPVPSCKTYVATCVSAGVASAIITNAASGYNPAAPPAVVISGGGGTGASGTAVIGSGAITSSAIEIAGTGYANGTHTNVNLTGGTGTGARATVITVGGIVTSVTITAAGTGYLSSDHLGLNTTDMGGVPSVAARLTIVSNYGKVTSITIVSGSGYTSAPTITIAVNDAGTATALATAVLNACPDVTDPGCSGTPVVIPQGSVPVGSSISLCSISGTPSVPSTYSVAQSGNCLCNCTLSTIGVTGTAGQRIRYFYTTCGGAVVTGILTVGGSPASIIVCAVTGSIVFQTIDTGATGTISLGGAC